jgi:hypothetical protein
MVKIERPSSIFGKKSFAVEQSQLRKASNDTTHAILRIDPIIAGVPPELVTRDKKKRLKDALVLLRSAKKRLQSIGV